MKKTSKAVKESRARAGVKPTSVAMTDAEKAEWDAFARELNLSRKDALFEAIRNYKGQGAITREQLLAEIERRLK